MYSDAQVGGEKDARFLTPVLPKATILSEAEHPPKL
jgi:hypothetical protein